MMRFTKILASVFLLELLACVEGKDLRSTSSMLELSDLIPEGHSRHDGGIIDLMEDFQDEVHGIVEEGLFSEITDDDSGLTSDRFMDDVGDIDDHFSDLDSGPLSDDFMDDVPSSDDIGDHVSDLVDDVVDSLVDNADAGDILDIDLSDGNHKLDVGSEYDAADHVGNVADAVDDVIENYIDLAKSDNSNGNSVNSEYDTPDFVENIMDGNVVSDVVENYVDAAKNDNSNDHSVNSDQKESDLLDTIEHELQDFGNNLGLSVTFPQSGNNIGQTVRDLTIYSRLLNFYALQRYRYYDNLYSMFNRLFTRRV